MEPLARPDCVFVTGVTYPALVGAADAVFTKPGYGIHAECALAGTPVVFLRRPGFPEAQSLEEAFVARRDVAVADATAAGVARALEEVWSRPRPEPVAARGAAQIAERVMGLCGAPNGPT